MAGCTPGIGLRRVGERVAGHGDEGMQPRLEAIDARQQVLDELHARQRPGSQPIGHLEGAQPVEVRPGHLISQCSTTGGSAKYGPMIERHCTNSSPPRKPTV